MFRRVAGAAGLFAEQSVAGITAADLRTGELFHPPVDRGDQIGGARLAADILRRKRTPALLGQISGRDSQLPDEVDHGQRP